MESPAKRGGFSGHHAHEACPDEETLAGRTGQRFEFRRYQPPMVDLRASIIGL